MATRISVSSRWLRRLPGGVARGMASAIGVILTALLLVPAHAAEDFLAPEKAFQFAARPIDGRRVEVSYVIAPGYYLYREQFRFDSEGAVLGAAALPAGKVKFDETFQKDVETYRGTLRIVLPVESGSAFRLVATSQGCADAGLCYPPMQSAAAVDLATVVGPAGLNGPAGVAVGAGAEDASTIESVLRGGAFWSVVGAFFLAGVLLSLTPCVLPMLPIVSSIVIGQGGSGASTSAAALSRRDGTVAATSTSSSPAASISRRRGFALAASYSFGMAVVYTAFGVAAGLAGEGLAAALQNPWVLGAFSLGLVGLALSMFNVYNLQLPQALTCRFSQAADKLPAGRVAGVCAMGGVSALIVSPCVAAPLAGALLYLSQTRDVWLGGTALFSLAAGMSVPLLLIGASAGALVPRAGAWMVQVKAAFGVLLLGVAVWTIAPVLPAALVLALWGVVAFVGVALALAAGRTPWRLGIAGLLALVGVLEIVGAASGGSDPLQPLARLAAGGRGEAASAGPKFAAVSSVGELDAALRTAGRPVMLDFYADWCVSCKEMDRFTFSDPRVQQRLAGALLLKADVTANDTQHRELLKRFRLFGPPGTIFFDANGQELAAARVIGYQNSERFLATLRSAGL